jgi:hypothetical protein
MADQIECEEGGPCPLDECGGTILLAPVENCSCHINPPCGACENQGFTCSECFTEFDRDGIML